MQGQRNWEATGKLLFFEFFTVFYWSVYTKGNIRKNDLIDARARGVYLILGVQEGAFNR